MSRISEATIQEVTAKADALTIIGEYVRLEKKSGRYWGLCPFHNEKTPSFSVDPDRKFYYCFGCSKGGGILNFIMEMEKLSYPEAIEAVASKVGVEVQYEGGEAPSVADGAKERRDRLIELYGRVAGSFNHILSKTESGGVGRDYLASRGVDTATVERFRLGYSPADRRWLYGFLSKKGYSDDFLASSGLFSRNSPRSAFFSDRLMFPIADRQGRTIAFGARLLRGDGPKYLNSAESDIFKKGENLFALDLALPEIRRLKIAHVCEGYMDVIALHRAGVGTAVAPLGTAFTETQARLLLRWAERVRLVFDSDEAGMNAAVKGIHVCRKVGLPCSIVTVQGGKDPADILLSSGAEALQKAVECFINDFDYLVERARARFDVGDTEGVAQAVAFMFPFLETLDTEVSRDTCVGAISDAFGVDRRAVARDFARYTGAEPDRRPNGPVPGRVDLRMNDELFLLLAVVVNRELYQKLRSSVLPEEFDDPRAKELFVVLEECYRNESWDFDGLIGRIGDEGLRAFVLSRSASEAFKINPEQIVHDGITRVRQKALERRSGELLIRLRTLRSGEVDSAALEDLIAEKMHIDAELSRLKDVTE